MEWGEPPIDILLLATRFLLRILLVLYLIDALLFGRLHRHRPAILIGTGLNAGRGYIVGYITGYGVGSIINQLLEDGVPGYVKDPELPNTVAGIAGYTGLAMYALNGFLRSCCHAPDQSLSWRRFCIEVLR